MRGEVKAVTEWTETRSQKLEDGSSSRQDPDRPVVVAHSTRRLSGVITTCLGTMCYIRPSHLLDLCLRPDVDWTSTPAQESSITRVVVQTMKGGSWMVIRRSSNLRSGALPSPGTETTAEA